MVAPQPLVPAKYLKLKAITSYLKPETYDALKAIAESEDRTVSNLVSRIVSDWVQAHPQNRRQQQEDK